MSRLFSDTTKEAEEILIELMRKAPAWRKVQMVAEMNKTVKEFAMMGLKQRYPDASSKELRRRLADILLGEKLAEEVYGPLDTLR